MTTFPKITRIDTGVHALRHADGTTRYKLWYHVNGKKRYVALPPRTTPEEARARRDDLHAALKAARAVEVKHNDAKPRGPKPGTGKYIYRRPAYIVRIRGKQLGEFHTEEEAQKVVEKWLTENTSAMAPPPHRLPSTKDFTGG